MKDKLDLTDSYFFNYKDRGMKKWMTAFSIGELTKAINETKNEAKKDIACLPQQELSYIEQCLELSIKRNKVLEIQLNTRDELGRVKDHVLGTFRGFADLDVVVINTIKGSEQYDQYIDFRDIRHVIVRNYTKWSNVDDDAFGNMENEITPDIDEFYNEYFDDGDFIE